MGTFSRYFVATGMALGLIAAQVAPALADSETSAFDASTTTSASIDVGVYSSCLLVSGKERRQCVKTLQERMKREKKSFKEQSKEDEKSSAEHERKNRRTGSGAHAGTGSGSVTVDASLSFGRLVSDIRHELNDFRQNVQHTLNDQRARISALSASARSALYTQIRTLVHNALLDLQVKISAAISAAVGV